MINTIGTWFVSDTWLIVLALYGMFAAGIFVWRKGHDHRAANGEDRKQQQL